MSEPSNANRRVIPASCSCAGVTRGFANVAVLKLPNGQIEIDSHVTGSCVLTIGEDAARALQEALGDWLG